MKRKTIENKIMLIVYGEKIVPNRIIHELTDLFTECINREKKKSLKH